jgi:D-alanine-D-alanine ligase-like ATP-grasp enzyme/methylase of polypeptide subunit release factors
MRVGVIRTVGSPCRCAESISRGLEGLGHKSLLADSEEIEFRASELAQECDLVIDHTDTFRGKGLFRPLVRLLLEMRGARIVGSGSAACFLADDKVAAKIQLSKAGIPTPPGVVVQTKAWDLPPWLRPPLVLKPAFEHMSRGLGLAGSAEEARAMVSDLLARLQQPVLVEMFVPGRELAVSLVDGPRGLEVLPPLEWRPETSELGMLTEAFKLKDVAGERRDAFPAEVPKDILDDLEALCRRAFQALGLRDYARFDLRLSPGGSFFFLEANTTPSLEPMEALALSAKWAGLDYPGLVERMLSAGLRRYGEKAGNKGKKVRIELPTGRIELNVPEGVHHPPASTIDLAKLLDVRAGESVLELGCGTGLLSIAAAKLGARHVIATDLDPRALEATLCNAQANGVGDRIEVRAGSWYEALERTASPHGRNRKEKFEVIIATPPQTPGPHPFGPRHGGKDGTRHLFSVIEGSPLFLEPVRGRLWLLAISLAHPSALMKRLKEIFQEVSLVQETERRFTADEYEAIEKGLYPYFLALRASGQSEFEEVGNGQYVFHNRFLRAARLRR